MDKSDAPLALLEAGEKPRRWTFGVGVALFLIGGLALPVWWWHAWTQAMHDTFTGKTGPVESRADWPRPLQGLLDASDGIEIDHSRIQVHSLRNGAFDREYVWRMDAAPGLFELLERRWKLSPVNASEWVVLEGYISSTRVQTPAWWSPRDDGQTSFYMGALLYDGDGDRFCVALDRNRSTIWVHFLYTF